MDWAWSSERNVAKEKKKYIYFCSDTTVTLTRSETTSCKKGNQLNSRDVYLYYTAFKQAGITPL